MAFSPAAMIVGANAIRSTFVKMKLHSDDPGNGGAANATTAGVQTFTWGAATNDGDFDLNSPVNFSGGTPLGPVTHCSLWNADETVWGGNFILTGDQTFNSAGEYVVTALPQNGSAT
ncbi:hypothetical protein I5J36_gp25 [Mycobacterium phage Mendokysei]|uniref:Uncharacterized protein n=1 Tax=Mycobacterium phage Mendokysei TaxID=2099637 RepID=A0A2P1CG72_9CAUD|nr:hypothetical protein I5J36_gp25 [Mycobacterium phage Mendokysei]AVJ50242.1 hypothetical protein SEA_MENDOKYSEI_25 [Mycobacterium phage Mendokysei]